MKIINTKIFTTLTFSMASRQRGEAGRGAVVESLLPRTGPTAALLNLALSFQSPCLGFFHCLLTHPFLVWKSWSTPSFILLGLPASCERPHPATGLQVYIQVL